MELPDLPEGWRISFLCIRSPGDCIADVTNDDTKESVYAKGTTLRYAMLDAIRRIEEGEVWGRAKPQDNAIDVLKILNIPQPKVVRRV